MPYSPAVWGNDSRVEWRNSTVTWEIPENHMCLSAHPATGFTSAQDFFSCLWREKDKRDRVEKGTGTSSHREESEGERVPQRKIKGRVRRLPWPNSYCSFMPVLANLSQGNFLLSFFLFKHCLRGLFLLRTFSFLKSSGPSSYNQRYYLITNGTPDLSRGFLTFFFFSEELWDLCVCYQRSLG